MSKSQNIDEFIATLRRHLMAVERCGLARIVVDVQIMAGPTSRDEFVFRMDSKVACTCHVSRLECEHYNETTDAKISRLLARIEELDPSEELEADED